MDDDEDSNKDQRSSSEEENEMNFESPPIKETKNKEEGYVEEGEKKITLSVIKDLMFEKRPDSLPNSRKASISEETN
jgi:hypothetical protein